VAVVVVVVFTTTTATYSCFLLGYGCFATQEVAIVGVAT